MSFYEPLTALRGQALANRVAEATATDVERVLAGSRVDADGFLVLLSDAAQAYLEPMAQRAHELTVQHFGRVILLYTPIYLANYCSNYCRYCGFAAPNRIERHLLSLEELEREAAAIRAACLRDLLLLTGDAPGRSTIDYICRCVELLRPGFAAISLEVQALTGGEYRALVEAGADGLTIYQETYDQEVYAAMHPRGPKRDFRFRLEAPERAAAAGMRLVGVGALLGLADWRLDAFRTGLHAHYLQRTYPEVDVSVSLPRIRPHEGAFQPAHAVSDRELVQILLALRLFLPCAGITLSTREAATFRDHLIPLGVTKMSAGTSTAVGGRTRVGSETGQFEISDGRDVPAVKQAIEAHGYKPLFTDWHPLHRTGPAAGLRPTGSGGPTDPEREPALAGPAPEKYS